MRFTVAHCLRGNDRSQRTSLKNTTQKNTRFKVFLALKKKKSEFYINTSIKTKLDPSSLWPDGFCLFALRLNGFKFNS